MCYLIGSLSYNSTVSCISVARTISSFFQMLGTLGYIIFYFIVSIPSL
nr:MAG TPA: hypothetical protein [Crassvirales sp.]